MHSAGSGGRVQVEDQHGRLAVVRCARSRHRTYHAFLLGSPCSHLSHSRNFDIPVVGEARARLLVAGAVVARNVLTVETREEAEGIIVEAGQTCSEQRLVVSLVVLFDYTSHNHHRSGRMDVVRVESLLASRFDVVEHHDGIFGNRLVGLSPDSRSPGHNCQHEK